MKLIRSLSNKFRKHIPPKVRVKKKKLSIGLAFKYIWKYLGEKVKYQNKWVKINYYEDTSQVIFLERISIDDKVRMVLNLDRMFLG